MKKLVKKSVEKVQEINNRSNISGQPSYLRVTGVFMMAFAPVMGILYVMSTL